MKWVVNTRQPRPASGANKQVRWIIYLPDGVYGVSDTIAYSVELPLLCKRHGMIHPRIWGQGCERTIIRLKNHSPGFGTFGRTDVTSTFMGHYGHRHATKGICSGTVRTVAQIEGD
jgi:hypothetical protein